MCVALGIQHAMRMRHIIYLWPARLHNIFPRYLINGTIIEKKKVTEHKMCVLILSTTFFILRGNERDIIKCVLIFM